MVVSIDEDSTSVVVVEENISAGAIDEERLMAVGTDDENISVDAVAEYTISVEALDGENLSFDVIGKVGTSVAAVAEASIPVISMDAEGISTVKELSRTVKVGRPVCSEMLSDSIESIVDDIFAIELCNCTVWVGEITLVLSVGIETESWCIEDDGSKAEEVMGCNLMESVIKESIEVYPCIDLDWKTDESYRIEESKLVVDVVFNCKTDIVDMVTS